MSDASVPDEVTPQVSDLPVVSVTRQPGVVTLWIQLPPQAGLENLRSELRLKFPGSQVELLICQIVTDLESGIVNHVRPQSPTLSMTIHEDNLGSLQDYLSGWCRINELQLNFALSATPVLGV